MATCRGPECTRDVEHVGLCHAHYEQRRRRCGGDECMTPLRPTDARGRFFLNVVRRADGCLIWTAATDGDGRYGSFQYDGRIQRAHRVAYEWKHGPVPDGLVLDHLCRVTLCVNPDHLEPVTQRENILRGEWGGGKNARKTHCIRGHEFTAENTRVYRGGRCCRECARTRKDRERARAALPSAA